MNPGRLNKGMIGVLYLQYTVIDAPLLKPICQAYLSSKGNRNYVADLQLDPAK